MSKYVVDKNGNAVNVFGFAFAICWQHAKVCVFGDLEGAKEMQLVYNIAAFSKRLLDEWS